MRSSASMRGALAAVALVAACGAAHAQATAREAYTQALGREALLRKEIDTPTSTPDASALLLRRVRSLVAEYERVVRRFPRSGYSDNALYQAALLSLDAYRHSGEERDRRAAARLFEAVGAHYPSSSLIREIPAHVARLDETAKAFARAKEPPLLKAIRRETLPDTVRVTIEVEREVGFREERLDGPPRVFIDLQQTQPTEALKDATLAFPDDLVRQIRTGRRPNATRVVLDLESAARYSVYTVYNPFRIVIDFERARPAAAGNAEVVATRETEDVATKDTKITKEEPGAAWGAVTPAPPQSPPAVPAANAKGGFSLSRQLGLGISRVVIDPGHGGHDPGARVKGLNEAELVLDVALRLEKLLLAQPGVEVVLTRRTNVYLPLEERTAIANRAGADLFLSIHANASRNPEARGIETYFLNFALNPEAEAIAARENAGSARTMGNLPDIVKAIALNNKIDESREFASLVQASMYDRLRKANREARNLGVKQAPFMVLIGATMPSALAEISFLTNRQEATLLRTASYRQAIAEALLAGISGYQRSLKTGQAVTAQ